MNLTVRYATADDADTLGRIHALAWQATYQGIVPDERLSRMTCEDRQQYFAKVLSAEQAKDAAGEPVTERNAIVFVDEQPAGLICLGQCRDEDKDRTVGEIWGIYLLQEYWHRGVGGFLMNWGITELKKQNYQWACLWVLKDNLQARRFYEKMGFKQDDTQKEIVLGKVLTEYRYILKI